MRAASLSFAGDGPSRFSSCFPDRKSRIKWGLRVFILLLHAIFASPLFLLDNFLTKKMMHDHWSSVMYLVLFASTLVQYLLTACSSPGYVIDAVRAVNEAHATVVNASNTSNKDNNSLARWSLQTNPSSWWKLVMELYPPGQSTSRNWTCLYCNVIRPPRSKHCNKCCRCVLQFDHHCVWLGTCIGRANRCRFWWYVKKQFYALGPAHCISHSYGLIPKRGWWEDFIVIVLLALLIFCFIFLFLLLLFHSYLLLTNQTTYEIVRRQRIFYLRELPECVYPFSRGIYRNLCTFCCSRESIYTLEAIPSTEEIETRARPYSCSDIITCRCCW